MHDAAVKRVNPGVSLMFLKLPNINNHITSCLHMLVLHIRTCLKPPVSAAGALGCLMQCGHMQLTSCLGVLTQGARCPHQDPCLLQSVFLLSWHFLLFGTMQPAYICALSSASTGCGCCPALCAHHSCICASCSMQITGTVKSPPKTVHSKLVPDSFHAMHARHQI